MAKFLSFEKNGQTIFVNIAHIVAVSLKPQPETNKQFVTLLGSIVLKSENAGTQLYGMAPIEVVEFDTVEDALKFCNRHFRFVPRQIEYNQGNPNLPTFENPPPPPPIKE